MKFTKAAVASLTLPPGKTDHIEFDDDTEGFGIRLRSSGSRVWVAQLRVNGRTRRLTLGSVGRIELEAARTAARRFFAESILGTDPIAARAEARAKAAITVGSTVEAYLAAREDSLRGSSFKQSSRCLRRYFKQLHDLPVSSVTRAHVAKAVNEIASTRGKVSAARARSHLSSFFTWALKEGLGGESNPVTHTNDPAPDEQPRDRVLSPSEIRAIWQLLPDVDFGKVMRLLFLTACRRAEIGSLEWSEVDMDKASLTIRAERMKSGKAHKLPLVPEAVEILRSVAPRPGNKFVFGGARLGFTGFSLPMKELRGVLAASGDVAEHWSAHDIRRTVKSELSELEVAPWVSERILAHTRGGIEGVYDWSKLERPMRQALQLWADRLREIVDGTDVEPNNVIALHA
jgi:integrase